MWRFEGFENLHSNSLKGMERMIDVKARRETLKKYIWRDEEKGLCGMTRIFQKGLQPLWKMYDGMTSDRDWILDNGDFDAKLIIGKAVDEELNFRSIMTLIVARQRLQFENLVRSECGQNTENMDPRETITFRNLAGILGKGDGLARAVTIGIVPYTDPDCLANGRVCDLNIIGAETRVQLLKFFEKFRKMGKRKQKEWLDSKRKRLRQEFDAGIEPILNADLECILDSNYGRGFENGGGHLSENESEISSLGSDSEYELPDNEKQKENKRRRETSPKTTRSPTPRTPKPRTPKPRTQKPRTPKPRTPTEGSDGGKNEKQNEVQRARQVRMNKYGK